MFSNYHFEHIWSLLMIRVLHKHQKEGFSQKEILIGKIASPSKNIFYWFNFNFHLSSNPDKYWGERK